MEYININYVSPNIKNGFNNKYIMVIMRTLKLSNKVILYKIELNNINNITNEIRGFILNKKIKIDDNEYDNFIINIYEHKLVNNIIYLVFTKNLTKKELLDNKPIKLEALIKPNRRVEYKDDISFIDERFFRNEVDRNSNDFFILFVNREQTTQLIEPITININNTNIYVFDRYSNMIFKEPVLDMIKDKYNDKNKIRDKHNEYIVNYMIVNRNIKTFLNEYQPEMCFITTNQNIIPTCKINDTMYRPIYLEINRNNTIVSPVDSRVDIYTKKNNKMFICRMTPRDFQKIYNPYRGYLDNIEKKDTYCILKFKSSYYIPPDVMERDYLSVILGNFTYSGSGVGAGNRYYPEVLDKQPNTNLEYKIIISGQNIKNSYKLTNIKLKYFSEKNENWFEQGEELGEFSNLGGTVIVIFNRNIDFADDIKFNSKNKLDVFIKCRDLIGYIL